MSESNPYEPPKAEIADIFTTSDAGGSLEDGIAGNYDFKIMDVIKESWKRTKGIKRAYWGGMIIFMLIVVGVALILAGLLAGQLGVVGELLPNLLFPALTYPFLAGIMMMGVHRAVDLPVYAGQVFGSLGSTLPIVIASVLISLFTGIGFILLVIPGIYLAIAYGLAIPVVVDKQTGGWRAMEASRKAITTHWFKVFGLFLVMMAILILSSFTIIGLFWTLPMSTVVLGVLYRIVFGVERARPLPQ